MSHFQVKEGMRGSGRTTAAMRSAPTGAVYVWVSGQLDYPKRLARGLERPDLEIVSPNWLTDQRWRGRIFTAIVKDHACSFDPLEEQMFLWAQTQVRS